MEGLDTPDVTKVQGGAAGLFLAVLSLAVTSGLRSVDLAVVAGSAALVCVALIVGDAIVRHGRSGILANEMQGLQSGLALNGYYSEKADA